MNTSTSTRIRTCAAALGVATTVALLGAATPAHAQHGGGGARVIQTGTCSDGAHWKIKAKGDDGRIEVEAEIDSNRTGQRWGWVLTHDDSTSARGTGTTAGRSGSFSVERRSVDTPGTDTFRFRATHGGQVCVARVSYGA